MALISNSHICPHLGAILSTQTGGAAAPCGRRSAAPGWVAAGHFQNEAWWPAATFFNAVFFF